MHGEVRIFDGRGNLQKTITTEELQKRGDEILLNGFPSQFDTGRVRAQAKRKPAKKKKMKIDKICELCGDKFSHPQTNVLVCFSKTCRESLRLINLDKARARYRVGAEKLNKIKAQVKKNKIINNQVNIHP